MTRKEAKDFYPILQAFAEGKVIECRTKSSSLKGSDTPNGWTEMKDFEFWNNTEYRIKPEPKCRPFKNKEECWQEMQKHQPFGWIINIITEKLRMIEAVDKSEDTDNFPICINGSWWELAQVFKKYTFADGTPFGVEKE